MLALVVLGCPDAGRLARRVRAAERHARRRLPGLVVMCGHAGEAERMADRWTLDPQLLALETLSTCTRSNAANASLILVERGCTDAVVVTSCWHRRRARRHFDAWCDRRIAVTYARGVDGRGWPRERGRERAELRSIGGGGRGPS